MAEDLVVICPLEAEAVALRAAAPALHVERCGLGPAGIRRWAAEVQTKPGLVVLAGVAGGLCSERVVGSAAIVTEVITPERRVVVPSVHDGPRCRLATADRILRTPGEKRAMAASTGAELVDLESAAFVAVSAERGWAHAIVRGVSDGVEDELPEGIESLLDDEGRSRPGAAAAFLLRRPLALAALLRLGRRTAAAMAAAAPLVQRLAAEAGR
jgi:hypothetical protein